jgi:Cft2 family RNA processing exonuclease
MDGFPPHGLGFLSHAHVRVSSQNAKIVTTHTTAELSRLQGPGLLVSPYDRRFAVGRLDLELFASGHVPGGASLLVRWEGNEVLYAGTVNPRPSLGAEACQLRRSHTLVVGSRFGSPDFVFPPAAQEMERVCDRVVELISRGKVPVLLVTSWLGKAQPIAARLHEMGVEVWAHRKIVEGCRRLRDLGRVGGSPHRFKPDRARGGAVLWLTRSRKAPSLAKLEEGRYMLVSGEAKDPGYVSRMGCAEGFVLSDHADFEGLVSYINSVEPKRLVLLPGRAHTLAEHVQKRGRVVEVLEPRQLSMF